MCTSSMPWSQPLQKYKRNTMRNGSWYWCVGFFIFICYVFSSSGSISRVSVCVCRIFWNRWQSRRSDPMSWRLTLSWRLWDVVVLWENRRPFPSSVRWRLWQSVGQTRAGIVISYEKNSVLASVVKGFLCRSFSEPSLACYNHVLCIFYKAGHRSYMFISLMLHQVNWHTSRNWEYYSGSQTGHNMDPRGHRYCAILWNVWYNLCNQTSDK